MEKEVKKCPIIAGREKGPGPGRYALPPTIGFIGHDFTKTTRPAYTFHGRMSNKLYSVDSSPGPQYYIDAKITRLGRDGNPAYSMLGRVREPSRKFPQGSESFQTPGPGTYSPENSPPCNTQRKLPSYTMGSRTRYHNMDSVPAPNRYSLPALMGPHIPNKPAGSSFTISGHCKNGCRSEDLSKTPGPGRYNRTDPSIYLPRQPAFSMLGRHSFPNRRTLQPGPGTHNPEKVTVHKPQAPAFSLGIRHSEFVIPLVVNLAD